MAILKDLIVNGVSRFIGNVLGAKFIVEGGTSSQFLKGDGSLDSTKYVSSSTSGLKIEVVSSMPSSPDSNTVYIVR